MRKRAFKVVTVLITILVIGMCYGMFVIATKQAIPCIFNKITGLLCPGCGVTRMCALLMQGEILGAMHANPALFLISPMLLYNLATYVISYVRTGSWQIKKWQTKSLYIMIIILVVHCVVRNVFYLKGEYIL